MTICSRPLACLGRGHDVSSTWFCLRCHISTELLTCRYCATAKGRMLSSSCCVLYTICLCLYNSRKPIRYMPNPPQKGSGSKPNHFKETRKKPCGPVILMILGPKKKNYPVDDSRPPLHFPCATCIFRAVVRVKAAPQMGHSALATTPDFSR